MTGADEERAALLTLELTRLRVEARLKDALLGLQFSRAAPDLIADQRRILSRLRRSSDTPYFLGQPAHSAQLAELDGRLLEFRLQQLEQEAELHALLGRPLAAPLPAPPPLRPAQPPGSLAELLAAAEQAAPELLLARTWIQRDQLEVDLARKGAWPDPTISFGYYAMGALPDMFEVQVGMTIPLHRRDARLAERRALLEQSRGDYEAVRLELLREIRRLHGRALLSAERLKLYGELVIPESRRAMDSYLAGYEGGIVDFMAVQASFMTVLESQLTRLEEMLHSWQVLFRLEELTGLKLVG